MIGQTPDAMTESREVLARARGAAMPADRVEFGACTIPTDAPGGDGTLAGDLTALLVVHRSCSRVHDDWFGLHARRPEGAALIAPLWGGEAMSSLTGNLVGSVADSMRRQLMRSWAEAVRGRVAASRV